MWDALCRLMAPPVFAGDEEKTRVAVVFNGLLWSFLFLILAFACLALPTVVVRKGAALLIIAVLVGIWAGVRALLRAGHVRGAIPIWLAATWTLATSLVILAGGVRTIAAAFFLSVPVLAGLLLGRGSALTAFVLCGLTAAGLAALEAIGRLPHPYFPGPPAAAWATLMAAMAWTVVPLNLAVRSLRQALATAREQVAERTRAEESLRQTQGVLAEIVDSVPQSIFWKDRDSVYLGCNRVFATAAGLEDPRQIVGKTDFDLPWPRAEAEAYRADDREVITTNRPKRHILEPLHRADGSRLWIDTTKVPLLDAQGSPRGVMGVFEDVTERKGAEDALRASEARFRQLFDGAADAFFLHDQRGRILDVNRAACESLGYMREALLKMAVPDVEVKIQPTDLSRQWEGIRGGDRVTVEGAHRRRDGSTFPVEVRIIPFEYAGHPLMFAAARDISERKRAEEAIREGRETINAIVEASSDWIWAMDAQGRHTYSNPAAAKILGYPVEEILRIGLDLLHEEDKAWVEAELPKWIASRRGWTNILLRWRHREGRYRHLESSAVPILGPDGELLGFRGVDRDVTERIQAEEILRAHRDRLEAVQAINTEIARELDLDRLLALILQRAMELAGAEAGVIMLWEEDRQALLPRLRIGEFWGKMPVRPVAMGEGVVGTVAQTRQELIINDYRAWAGARQLALAHTAITASLGEPLLYRDQLIGVINLIHAAGKGIFGAHHGALLRLFGDQAAIAISNARLFQEERQRREQLEAVRRVSAEIASELDLGTLLQLILERATHLVAGNGGAILMWDDAEQHLNPGPHIGALATIPRVPVGLDEGMVGRVAATRRGLVVNDYQTWEGARPIVKQLGLRAGIAEPLTFGDRLIGVLNVTSDREERRFSEQDSGLLRLFADQAAIAIENARLYEASRRELSDRQQAEGQRVRLETELRQAQKMETVGRLAGGIAHDLNNLLTPILGYAELALMRLGPERAKDLGVPEIEEAAKRARDLTHQLLAFSRRQPMELKLLNLSEMVAKFEKILRRTLREDIRLTNRLAPNLGAVRADQAQLQQVLLNLIVNANDAIASEGTITVTTDEVTCAAEDVVAPEGVSPGPYVRLVVRDTGCGMDAEVQQHLFEPFYTTKPEGKGTGLGLATCYGIVRQHGGFFRVDSAPGRGSSFSVYIPRAAQEVPTPEKAIDAPVVVGKETILFIDDSRTVRAMLHDILRTLGYDPIEAATPPAAVQAALEYDGPIHLLITDVIMPGMNGRQLYEALRPVCPELKVLYVSGYTDDIIAPHGVLEPGTHFLAKPFTVAGLSEKIREALRGA